MKLEDFKAIIEHNSLQENNLADVESILKPITHETYPNTLFYYISNVQPLDKPTGIVNSIESYLTGNDESVFDDTRTIMVGDLVEKGYSTGDLVQGSKFGEGTVLYINKEMLVVKLLTPDSIFVPFENIEGKRIKAVYSSKAFTRRVLEGYSTTKEYNNINLRFNQHKLEAITNKIKAKTTLEVIQDIKKIHKKGFENVISAMMSSQIRSEMDRELVNYLKTVARPVDDLIVKDIEGSTFEKFQHIAFRITRCITDICNKTHKPNRGYAIVSPGIADSLIPHLTHYNTAKDEIYLGRIGTMKIYQDFGADEDVVIVGFKSEYDGDAGLIFAPYNQTLVTKTDSHGDPILFMYNRYAYTINPQDINPEDNQSDFFMMFSVDLRKVNDWSMLTDEPGTAGSSGAGVGSSGRNQGLKCLNINWNGDGKTNVLPIDHKEIFDVEIYGLGFLLEAGIDYIIENQNIIFLTIPLDGQYFTVKYCFLILDSEYRTEQEVFISDGTNTEFTLRYNDIVKVQVYDSGLYQRENSDYFFEQHDIPVFATGEAITRTVPVLNGATIRLATPSYEGAVIKVAYKRFVELSVLAEEWTRYAQLMIADGEKNIFYVDFNEFQNLVIYNAGMRLTEMEDYDVDVENLAVILHTIPTDGQTITFHYEYK